MTKNKIRNNSIDTWKGIAIVAVIGIHASNDAIAFPLNDPNHWVGLIFRSILNFAVPLFFAISGYFSPSWETINKQGIPSYYQKRLLPLWIPYVIWTIIYIFLENRTHIYNPILLGKDFLLGNGIGIGYFVIVLTSLIIIHPILAYLGSKKSLSIAALISLISVITLYWTRIEFGNRSIGNFPITGIFFTTWMIFFYLGYYIQSHRIVTLTKTKILIFLFIAFALNAIESFLIMSNIGIRSIAASQIKISTFIYSLFISIYALNHHFRRWNGQKYFVWLGQHSFVIYLCHMLFLKLINDGLEKYLRDNQLINIVATTALTLLIVSLFIHMVKCTLPNHITEFLLGVKHTKSVVTSGSAVTANQKL